MIKENDKSSFYLDVCDLLLGLEVNSDSIRCWRPRTHEIATGGRTCLGRNDGYMFQLDSPAGGRLVGTISTYRKEPTCLLEIIHRPAIFNIRHYSDLLDVVSWVLISRISKKRKEKHYL